MRIKICWILILLLSYTAVLYSETNPPTPDQVRTELRKLTQKESEKERPKAERKVEQDNPFFLWLQDLFSFIAKLIGPLIRFIVLNIHWLLIAAGLVILYFIIRNLDFKKGKKLAPDKAVEFAIQSKKVYHSFEHYYEKAVQSAADCQYEEALTFLHKATVEYIRDHFVLKRDAEYTNREYRILIQNQEVLSKAFKQLALFAESAKFGSKSLSDKDYMIGLELFKESFWKAYES